MLITGWTEEHERVTVELSKAGEVVWHADAQGELGLILRVGVTRVFISDAEEIIAALVELADAEELIGMSPTEWLAHRCVHFTFNEGAGQARVVYGYAALCDITFVTPVVSGTSLAEARKVAQAWAEKLHFAVTKPSMPYRAGPYA